MALGSLVDATTTAGDSSVDAGRGGEVVPGVGITALLIVTGLFARVGGEASPVAWICGSGRLAESCGRCITVPVELGGL